MLTCIKPVDHLHAVVSTQCKHICGGCAHNDTHLLFPCHSLRDCVFFALWLAIGAGVNDAGDGDLAQNMARAHSVHRVNKVNTCKGQHLLPVTLPVDPYPQTDLLTPVDLLTPGANAPNKVVVDPVHGGYGKLYRRRFCVRVLRKIVK